MQRIIEMYLPGQLLRQFGEVQGVPTVTTYFACVSREVTDWGVCIQPRVVIAEFDALQELQWGWRVGVIDLGTTPQYDAWWDRHRSIPLTDSTIPITPQQIPHMRQQRRVDREERGGDEGRGGDEEGGIDEEGDEDINIDGDMESNKSGADDDSTLGSSSSEDGDDDDIPELEVALVVEGGGDGGQGGDEDDDDPQILRVWIKSLEDEVA
ncbi:uncharacterized protein LOC131050899 [Cryptomeria japonica]|uniref:uncharacterized protein LOC131050899 n=1 Tax=Cryptomeria japonica TaxID=3369 RepID=UPI0027DA8A30|nr:uncharacterized protein LOC131050899 [Cryptomeria japonica]